MPHKDAAAVAAILCDFVTQAASDRRGPAGRRALVNVALGGPQLGAVTRLRSRM